MQIAENKYLFISATSELEYIDEVDGGFGQADIVLVFLPEFRTAFRTFKDVIFCICVSGSEFELEIPVLSEDDGIAVGDTRPSSSLATLEGRKGILSRTPVPVILKIPPWAWIPRKCPAKRSQNQYLASGCTNACLRVSPL